MKCSILWYIFYEIIFTNAHSYNHAREHRRKKEDNKQETQVLATNAPATEQPVWLLFNFKRTLTTLHKDYMATCSLLVTQRPHNYHLRFSRTRTLHGDLAFSRL